MVKHARPAAGMGGVFSFEVDRLQRMGVLIAVAGTVAVAAALLVGLLVLAVRAAPRQEAGRVPA